MDGFKKVKDSRCQRGRERKLKQTPSPPASSPLLLLLCRRLSIQQKQPEAFPVSQSRSSAAPFTTLPLFSVLLFSAFLSAHPGGNNVCEKMKRKRKRGKIKGREKNLAVRGRSLRRRASGDAEIASSLAAPDPDPLSPPLGRASVCVCACVCSGI